MIIVTVQVLKTRKGESKVEDRSENKCNLPSIITPSTRVRYCDATTIMIKVGD